MKKQFLKIISLITAALLIASLTSCETADTIDTETADVTFTDALGRSVSINKNPRRVAALLGSFADVWVLSGGELCAAPSDAQEDFGIDLSGITNVGGAHSPNAEMLIASAPELVLASASTASHVSLMQTLTSAGITVAYFDVDNFYDYLEMLDICTTLTERRDLYEIHGLLVKEKIELIKENYKKEVLDTDKNRVLLLRAASSFIKAKGSTGTVLGEMLADLGCQNIADSDKTVLDNLSIEAIIKEPPYRIFAVTMGNDEEAARATLDKTLKENTAWQTLEAVKEERVYVLDKALFNLKPNERWAEAYEILYEKLTEE